MKKEEKFLLEKWSFSKNTRQQFGKTCQKGSEDIENKQRDLKILSDI